MRPPPLPIAKKRRVEKRWIALSLLGAVGFPFLIPLTLGVASSVVMELYRWTPMGRFELTTGLPYPSNVTLEHEQTERWLDNPRGMWFSSSRESIEAYRRRTEAQGAIWSQKRGGTYSIEGEIPHGQGRFKLEISPAHETIRLSYFPR